MTRAGRSATPAAGAAHDLARRIVLQAVDLPGGGWNATPVPDGAFGTTDGGDDDLDACLEGFPDAAVVASADSDRFTRELALAWSVAWVLDDEASTVDAATRLADPGFAECFVASAAAAVDPDEGAAELLGHVAVPVDGLPGGTTTRARITAALPNGLVVVHLDLLVLTGGVAVTLVVLVDSPDPTPPADALAVAGRVARRLPG